MIVSGRLVETGRAVELMLDTCRVGHIQTLDSVTDVWIAPGFIDIQVNGYAGHDANAADVTPETIAGSCGRSGRSV